MKALQGVRKVAYLTDYAERISEVDVLKWPDNSSYQPDPR